MIFLVLLIQISEPEVRQSSAIACYEIIDYTDPNLKQFINGATISQALPEDY